MKMSRLFILAILVSFSCSAFADLQSLDNGALSDISGKDGIGLGFELRLNADASGNSKCGSAIPLIECRIALSLDQRWMSGSAKEWLVIKGVSGRIVVPYLALDAGDVTYTTDANASVSIPAAVFGADPNNPVRLQKIVVSNLAIETDSGSTPGYMAASESGFMGLRIDDSNSITTPTTPFLGVQLTGTVKMFPCNADHQSC